MKRGEKGIHNKRKQMKDVMKQTRAYLSLIREL